MFVGSLQQLDTEANANCTAQVSQALGNGRTDIFGLAQKVTLTVCQDVCI